MNFDDCFSLTPHYPFTFYDWFSSVLKTFASKQLRSIKKQLTDIVHGQASGLCL
ncbi:hypothetical protein JCM19047_2645 [Bacillus sp. JCM 19047]|nr:hypothetical protein JCM19047_2645 [Bacillus sp. JCM 19047]